MKKVTLFIFAMVCINMTFSQTTTDLHPKAVVYSQTINIDTIQYTFLSNYYIDEYKAPMLAGRLLNRYPEIIEIDIDSQTQTIVFKTLTVGSVIFLEEFVKHFKYSGYEIH